MLEVKDLHAARKLADLMVEAASKDATSTAAHQLDAANTLNDMLGFFVLFAMHSETEGPDMMLAWLGKALSWSAKLYTQHSKGAPSLHDAAGELCLKHQLWHKAVQHLLWGTDVGSLRDALAGQWQHCDAHERQFFVARTVLSLLALGRTDAALGLAESMADAGGVADTPLGHGVWLLALAVARNSAALFDAALAAYKPVLSVDPSFGEYVDTIANVAFDRPMPSKGGLGELLSSMMSSMMGGQ